MIATVVGRRTLGVRHQRVYCPLDDPNYIVDELEFDTPAEAQTCGEVRPGTGRKWRRRRV